MQVFVQGGGETTRWRFCVCLCVFQVRRGQPLNSVEDSAAWRFTYTPQTWKPEVCMRACVRSCNSYLLWTLSNLPRPAKSPPAAVFCLCAEYFLKHGSKSNSHTTLKHGFTSACGRTSYFMFVESFWCSSNPSCELVILKLKVTHLGFAPTQEGF